MSKRSRRKEKRLKQLMKERKVVTGEAPVVREREAKGVRRIYEEHYRKLLLIPFIILFIALVQILVQTATTGEFIHKDVSLKGGVTISISSDVDAVELQSYLSSRFTDASIEVRTLKSYGAASGILIETDIDPSQKDAFESELERKTGISRDEFSVEEIGSTLGARFFRQTLSAILLAFFFMGIVVFIYFRTLAPSAAVILAAFSDIVVTVAITNVLGIKLSAGGIAAFLMLIGYSVDTDILLSTRVFKRKEGAVMSRVYDAMKTGLTMTFTTLAAVTIALIIAASPVLRQIMTVLLIGLIVDLINTWIQNVGIIRWYLDVKG